MNVLFIIGSAKKDGITAKLCDLASLSMKNENVSFLYPIDMDISHCTGCNSCSTSGKCVIDDDMDAIYKAVDDSDAVILATPVHFSGPSSILKQVIDRFQCIWLTDKGKAKDKVAGLIVNGGSPSPIFSNTVSIAKAFANTVGAEWIAELKVGDTDNITDVPEELTAEAREFGERIIAAASGIVSRKRP